MSVNGWAWSLDRSTLEDKEEMREERDKLKDIPALPLVARRAAGGQEAALKLGQCARGHEV